MKNIRNTIPTPRPAYYYLSGHLRDSIASCSRLSRNLYATLMTVAVMAIAISLALGFYLLLANVSQLTDTIQDSRQMSIFLHPSISDKTGRSLAQQIRKNPQLAKVTLISRKQALQEFKNYSSFAAALDILQVNPLPVVIQVLPAADYDDLVGLNLLLKSFNKLPQVDFTQLDMQWVRRLQSIMQLLERVALLLGGLLGLAAVFISGNSIRLELQSRRTDVQIAKLIGATDAFIRRPFLWAGFWLGLASGAVAWWLVTVLLMLLQQPIEKLSLLYAGSFNVLYLNGTDTLLLLLASALLGIIGAQITLVCLLQQIKPQ